MINLYLKNTHKEILDANIDFYKKSDLDDIVWIDLFNATAEEKEKVEQLLDVHLVTREQAEEIESTSRYSETPEGIICNLNYGLMQGETIVVDPVSFLITRSNILVTVRQSDFPSFTYALSGIMDDETELFTSKRIFIILTEAHIDHMADMVEQGTRHISELAKNITAEEDIDKSILKRISELQEQTMTLRENIFDMQRVISGLKRSTQFSEEEKHQIQLMLEDVDSLLSHTDFSFQRLDYLQDVSLGLINIEQNEIVKIFSVAAVIFMPPTLVASIYGMNFKFMPELSWSYELENGSVIPIGYIFAIGLMLTFTMVTIWFFKYKKWL